MFAPQVELFRRLRRVPLIEIKFQIGEFQNVGKWIDPLFQIEFNRRRIAGNAESRFNGFSIIGMLIIGDPLCNRVNQNSCPILISKLALILIHLIFAILNFSPSNFNFNSPFIDKINGFIIDHFNVT